MTTLAEAHHKTCPYEIGQVVEGTDTTIELNEIERTITLDYSKGYERVVKDIFVITATIVKCDNPSLINKRLLLTQYQLESKRF